jgi:2-polyprenyl-3-methyl-5-hydroxy-6-metoxy-1,4-benzoquinol methylase
MLRMKNTKKSWDSSWEKIFQKQSWGKYPPEELVRFVARNFYAKKSSDVKILDLGCGPGACSWYLAREGFSTTGIDGSKTAISQAKILFKKEKMEGTFHVMDFIKLNFLDQSFDAVIDINAIQHNPIEKVPEILDEVKRVLKSGGMLFSIIIGNGTTNESLFKKKGFIHFYKISEIKKIFKEFEIISIEKSDRTENNQKEKITHWMVTCRKR